MPPSGLERGAQIAAVCPACSSPDDQVHEVLKPETQATVRCLTCDHVHKVRIEASTGIDVAIVVSVGGESYTTSVEVPSDAVIEAGAEFVVDVDDAPVGVRVTALELGDGSRVETAEPESVQTIWSRAVDNVSVPVTIHPADGRRNGTESESVSLPGDATITVGESVPHVDRSLSVEGFVVRDDAIGYDRRSYRSRGDAAEAKDLKRIYARRAQTDTWQSAWG